MTVWKIDFDLGEAAQVNTIGDQVKVNHNSVTYVSCALRNSTSLLIEAAYSVLFILDMDLICVENCTGNTGGQVENLRGSGSGPPNPVV